MRICEILYHFFHYANSKKYNNMKFSYPCCNFILVCLALLGLLVSNGSEFVAAFTEDVHSKYSDQTQKGI